MKSCRKATSVIELMVVLTISTFVLGLLSQMMHRMLSHHHRAQANSQYLRETTRLANTFRHDIRHASDATMNDGHLTLTLQRGTVTYRQHGRTTQAHYTFAGTPPRREEFDFPKNCRVTFETGSSFDFVRLRIIRQDLGFLPGSAAPGDTPHRQIVVESRLGRHLAAATSQRAAR